MGIPVLILGDSGSGKSRSMKNLPQNEVMVLNVAGKPFPFRERLPRVNNATYGLIKTEFIKEAYKIYVIDDSQYLLAFEMFDRAKETGYGKFTDIAVHFKGLIQYVIKEMPDDVVVYFLHHTETLDNGKVKAKTVGKMLDNQITIEGLFSIVLLCETDGNTHRFVTQSDGFTTAKSPEGMFQAVINNDLKFVDDTIREYWGLNKIVKENVK